MSLEPEAREKANRRWAGPMGQWGGGGGRPRPPPWDGWLGWGIQDLLFPEKAGLLGKEVNHPRPHTGSGLTSWGPGPAHCLLLPQQVQPPTLSPTRPSAPAGFLGVFFLRSCGLHASPGGRWPFPGP